MFQKGVDMVVPKIVILVGFRLHDLIYFYVTRKLQTTHANANVTLIS